MTTNFGNRIIIVEEGARVLISANCGTINMGDTIITREAKEKLDVFEVEKRERNWKNIKRYTKFANIAIRLYEEKKAEYEASPTDELREEVEKLRRIARHKSKFVRELTDQMEFIQCIIPDCNRKYKTERSWKKHMRKDHGIDDMEPPETRVSGRSSTKKHKSIIETNKQRKMRLEQERLQNRVALEEREKEAADALIESNREAMESLRELREQELELTRLAKEKAIAEKEIADAIERKRMAERELAPANEISECVICMDSEPNAIIHGCNHVIACYDCLDAYSSNKSFRCPGCNTESDSFSKIYTM